MPRLGLTPDQIMMDTWCSDRVPRYATTLPGLNVLVGETLALVGDGTAALLDHIAGGLQDCLPVEGAVAAAGGTLRIQAVQAARVGVRALAVTDPFAGVGDPAVALALADLAGLADLGLTTVVSVTDVTLAALFADRVVVVSDAQPQVAYPVLAPTPRAVVDVRPITERVTARLAVGV